MPQHQRRISVYPYAGAVITSLGRKGDRCFQYLQAYLSNSRVNVTAIADEDHYVDRHYVEDFASFYSRSFSVPSAHCRRLHFFRDISDTELSEALSEAYASEGARKATGARLSDKYVGFVVIRPLEGAEMGRTVLATYPPEGKREYEVTRTYHVHLGAVPLEVQGLAFQQQDGGAAVCASTALWCALQQVARIAGYRTPTPSAITHAAESPFPASHGLDYIQIAAAMTKLGFIADQFVPGHNRGLFRAKVTAALRSHLPLILLLTRPQDGKQRQSAAAHAVTVTGRTVTSDIVPVPIAAGVSLRMRAGSLRTIYVHDDNVGAYVHYELEDSPHFQHEGEEALTLFRGDSRKTPQHIWIPGDTWIVDCALVPKPPKLRMPIEVLFASAAELAPVLRTLLEEELEFEVRYDQGTSYYASLFDGRFGADALQAFCESSATPRHIGVVSVYAAKGQHVCDVLLDVTEVQRMPAPRNVLGVVAPGVPLSRARKNLTQLCSDTFACRLLTPP